MIFNKKSTLEKAKEELLKVSQGYGLKVNVDKYVFKVVPRYHDIQVASNREIAFHEKYHYHYSPFNSFSEGNVKRYCVFCENYEYIRDSFKSQAEARARIDEKERMEREVCEQKLKKKMAKCTNMLGRKLG
jgi:hypothetical protein